MKPSHFLAAVPFVWLTFWAVSGAVQSANRLQADHIVGVNKKIASEPERVFSSSSPAKAPTLLVEIFPTFSGGCLAVAPVSNELAAINKVTRRRYTFSTYADKYVGRRMSNGKPYSHLNATVASNDYPLGTRLLLKSGDRTATAVVTDRMARRFSGLRIDLSRSLWNQLSGGKEPGLVRGWAGVEK